MPVPLDVSLHELERLARDILSRGGMFYQKWTCGKCGERVMMGEPNMLFIQGHHEEKADGTPCGYITDLVKAGGGITAVMSSDPEKLHAALHAHCAHQNCNLCCTCGRAKT